MVGNPATDVYARPLGSIMLMRLSFILLIQFAFTHVYAQKVTHLDRLYNQSGAHKLIFIDSLDDVTQLAEFDIDHGSPFLLLRSGIAPIVYTTDSIFENRYDTYYHDSGCTGPRENLAIAYNIFIFQHLTENNGKKWQSEVRKDVLGFKEWKRKKNKKK